MPEPTITKHARERMSQRRITLEQILKVLAFGTTRETSGNKVTCVGWLTKCLNPELSQDLCDIHVVHSGRTIVTVYR
ncbi:DUF4258 domain-containing protein [Adhaeretor mobilis]|uniref:DUF4258 domain-containing protein n=1 Tax=Adhaeretor mobilis TaxID=1930276 RepID=A0A517MQN2_9BACT|nr:DUF4258 domain-containing protein [Adhaeretor mobilis]QDS97191.1 hypothetical protein HG15A2_04510 [Adhaeretor mobilis]